MKKLIVCVVCFTVSTFVAVAGNGAPSLEGSWTIVAVNDDGKKIPDDEIKTEMMIVTIKEGKYSVSAKGKQREGGAYKLDGKANPPTIDLSITEGDEKGKSQLGIYKLEGDQVSFALAKIGAKDRPKNFDGGKDIEVTVLKRNK